MSQAVSAHMCVCVCVGYGGLALAIEGPSKVDIQTEDLDDGTCGVTYCPTEPGNYIVSIRFAEEHVPGKNQHLFTAQHVITQTLKAKESTHWKTCHNRKSVHCACNRRGSYSGEHHPTTEGGVCRQRGECV